MSWDPYGWLKDTVTALMNPPSPIVRAAQEHQGMRYTPQPVATDPEPAPPPAPSPAPAPMAATGRPAWARHTIPPETSASVRGTEYGCVGLCIGGTCAVCDGLADEITAARRIRVPAIRDVREASLLRRINSLRKSR